MKVSTRKIKCEFTQEMYDDLKNFHGFLDKEKNKVIMQHYEYKVKDKVEFDLIKEHAELDYEYYPNSDIVIFSINKKQLKLIKLGSINGIRDFVKLKKIIFESNIIRDVSKILEYRLSKELGTSIDKEILKSLLNK